VEKKRVDDEAPPPRAELYRVAKAVGEWDVDQLEREMPVCAIVEWNEYLNYELATLTRAILGALPAARQIGENGGGPVRLTKPEDVAAFFDGLNAKG